MRIPLFFPKLSVLGILRWDPGTWICLYISQVILMHNQVWCCFSSFPLISVQIAHHVTSETRPPPTSTGPAWPWSSSCFLTYLPLVLLLESCGPPVTSSNGLTPPTTKPSNILLSLPEMLLSRTWQTIAHRPESSLPPVFAQPASWEWFSVFKC